MEMPVSCCQMAKFPVDSLFGRELTPETGSPLTPSTATFPRSFSRSPCVANFYSGSGGQLKQSAAVWPPAVFGNLGASKSKCRAALLKK